MAKLKFIKTAATDFGVGAIARSSRYVLRRVLGLLGPTLQVVVEYGPGDGVMTKELLGRIAPSGRLIAIEPNEEFVRILKKIEDPRILVIRGEAQDAALVLDDLPRIDAIVSSIPFSFLTPEDRLRVVSDAYDALSPGGKFIVFHQYTPLMAKVMRERFEKVSVRFEIRNIFPCFIISAEK